MAPSSSGLGHHPLKVAARVRIPLGLLNRLDRGRPHECADTSRIEGGCRGVVDRGRPSELHGMITQFDLLAAQERILDEERHRERVLQLTTLPD